MNVLDMAEQAGKFVKAAAKDGGEYHGPCPGCGGRDRFHVWPEQNDGGGSYWCRQCRCAGDGIQFLRDFEGKSYKEACVALGVDPGGGGAVYRPMRPRETGSGKGGARKRGWEPKAADSPDELWAEKTGKFVGYCREKLQENEEQMAYLAGRGIDAGAVERYGLGWNPKDAWRPRESWGLTVIVKNDGKKKKLWLPPGIVIPVFNLDGSVRRVRIRRPGPLAAHERKYYVVPGSAMAPLVIGSPSGQAWIIIEAELDAMAVAAAAGDLVTVCALGSTSHRPDAQTAERMRGALCIMDALDYDGPAAKEAAFWRENFPQVSRWPVPDGKDPGEAFESGVDLRAWVLAGLPPRFRVRRASPCTVGRSLTRSACADEGAGAQATELQAGRQENDEGEEADVRDGRPPAGVMELARIMRDTPVSIVNRPDRITIDCGGGRWWDKNWEKYARISELLFEDGDVYNFVRDLPSGRYKGQNLMVDRMRKRVEENGNG